MSETFPMPQWGITMEEGTITEWLKAPGEPVAEGEVLAQVATDKIEVEFESPIAGIVAAHLMPEGETVECGTDIVVIAKDDEDYANYKSTNA